MNIWDVLIVAVIIVIATVTYRKQRQRGGCMGACINCSCAGCSKKFSGKGCRVDSNEFAKCGDGSCTKENEGSVKGGRL